MSSQESKTPFKRTPTFPLLVPKFHKPEDRANELEEWKNTGVTHPNQHVNVDAVIRDLRAGREPAAMYQNGRAVSLKDIDWSKDFWVENRIGYQYDECAPSS